MENGDERFTRCLVPAIEKAAGSAARSVSVYPVAIALMRERLLMLRDRFLPLRPETWGPGRVDTWNSAKAGLNYTIRDLPEGELRGATDFPSIWNQRKRKHRDDGTPMMLHWTGNTTEVNERNLSAAFGTGATPATVDHGRSVASRTGCSMRRRRVPVPHRQGEGRPRRGDLPSALASCHGKSGQDSRPVRRWTRHADRRGWHRFRPLQVVHVRARGSEHALRGDALSLHAFPQDSRLRECTARRHWLRAPYLHNGSVPTLRDLLNPPEMRPRTFYRGYDVLDPVNVGFVSNVREENGRQYFLYDTSQPTNRNTGHLWGVSLPPADKDAIVEYMKTF
jgi:hypothetical protein